MPTIGCYDNPPAHADVTSGSQRGKSVADGAGLRYRTGKEHTGCHDSPICNGMHTLMLSAPGVCFNSHSADGDAGRLRHYAMCPSPCVIGALALIQMAWQYWPVVRLHKPQYRPSATDGKDTSVTKGKELIEPAGIPSYGNDQSADQSSDNHNLPSQQWQSSATFEPSDMLRSDDYCLAGLITPQFRQVPSLLSRLWLTDHSGSRVLCWKAEPTHWCVVVPSSDTGMDTAEAVGKLWMVSYYTSHPAEIASAAYSSIAMNACEQAFSKRKGDVPPALKGCKTMLETRRMQGRWLSTSARPQCSTIFKVGVG